MDMISLQGKTNFFEKRVSDYQKANVNTGGTSNPQSAVGTGEDPGPEDTGNGLYVLTPLKINRLTNFQLP